MLSKARLASSLLLCTALGCSGGGTDTGPGPGPGPGPDPTEAMQLAGEYELSSHLDVALPADFEKRLQDLAEDPVGALADEIADQIGFDLIGPAIESALDDVLGNDFSADIQEMAQDILDISASFDVVSKLVIKGSGDALQGEHTPMAMEIVLNGDKYDWSYENVTATNTTITVRDDKLTIAKHQMSIPYGPMLNTVLDTVVADKLDAGSDTLADALSNRIDCDAIGASIVEKANFGDADLYAGLCEAGVVALSQQLYDMVADVNLDAALEISSTATFQDSNRDNKADSLGGDWNGSFAGNPGKMPFSGKRVR